MPPPRTSTVEKTRRRGSISTSEGVRLLDGNSITARNLLDQLG